MTAQEQALFRLIRELDTLGIPYMIAGSVASSFYGRPRTTYDADVVLDPTAAALGKLVAALEQTGFYVDAGHAQDALARRRQFNAIDTASGFKLDLIVRKDRPFSREEFRRRVTTDRMLDLSVTIATPEDAILSKLEWSRMSGGSEKQLADASGIVEVKGADLDRAYIEHWANELGVLDLWQQISTTL